MGDICQIYKWLSFLVSMCMMNLPSSQVCVQAPDGWIAQYKASPPACVAGYSLVHRSTAHPSTGVCYSTRVYVQCVRRVRPDLEDEEDVMAGYSPTWSLRTVRGDCEKKPLV